MRHIGFKDSIEQRQVWARHAREYTVIEEKPWVIMTLRRTGGTSLTTFLSRVSTFPTIEHEPFNKFRLLGNVTQAFRDTGDISGLEASIGTALEKRPNIKHCIEVVPIEITRALIDAALERDYHFIVLARRNEARRLSSLLLAQATDVWDREKASEIYPRIVSGEIKPTPIDLDSVQGMVRQNALAMGRTLTMLRNRGINFDWLLFEELYEAADPVEKQALDLARRMNIEVAPDDPVLSEVFAPGGQKSVNIAPYVENYQAAVKRLDRLCLQ